MNFIYWRIQLVKSSSQEYGKVESRDGKLDLLEKQASNIQNTMGWIFYENSKAQKYST